MNFNEYLKNVHTGMQLNEMLQNDALLSADEVKNIPSYFYKQLKINNLLIILDMQVVINIQKVRQY